MITQELAKSSRGKGRALATTARMPLYGWVGLATMIVFEVLLFATDSVFVGWFFTPIQWTGLILFLDANLKRRRGTSLVADHFGEFMILCAVSIASWLVFEGYNLVLKNWRYLSLPDNPWFRFPGYVWAFATISPGMFLIYETLSDMLPGEEKTTYPRLPNAIFWPFVIFGAACLIVPLIWPSTYMTPLVWMGFAFMLDPINGRLGERSILSEFFTGQFRSMPIFFLAGLVAGILWEFWNFWALAKWEYDVPYLGHVKLFEMPVLGFLGFMPFIIESHAIYRFVRRFIPIRDNARYLG